LGREDRPGLDLASRARQVREIIDPDLPKSSSISQIDVCLR
jgi:hypothetical protein